MVGTETGLVIGGNRKGKNPVEKLPSKVSNHIIIICEIVTSSGLSKSNILYHFSTKPISVLYIL